MPVVTPVEIRPYDNNDVQEIDPTSEDRRRSEILARIRGEIRQIVSRPDGVGLGGEEGLRGKGLRGAIRNRKYGWPEEGYDMDMARRQFQNDLTVAGKSVYDSRELTKIIDDVYDEINDDGYSTQNDFFDELEKRIVMYLNQCFAMNKEGSKCMYVEKMISIEYGTPTFEFRNEASVKMFLESATKNRGYEWPPPSHSTNIPSTGSETRKWIRRI